MAIIKDFSRILMQWYYIIEILYKRQRNLNGDLEVMQEHCNF